MFVDSVRRVICRGVDKGYVGIIEDRYYGAMRLDIEGFDHGSFEEDSGRVLVTARSEERQIVALPSNNGPTLPKTTPKGIALHAFGVQVSI